jgi:hypothetical protein
MKPYNCADSGNMPHKQAVSFAIPNIGGISSIFRADYFFHGNIPMSVRNFLASSIWYGKASFPGCGLWKSERCSIHTSSLNSLYLKETRETTMQLLQKNLNIKPTLEIRPGCQFNVIVTKDLVFQKPYAAGK